MWNMLPLSVRHASSISGYNKGVRDYLTARNVSFNLAVLEFLFQVV